MKEQYTDRFDAPIPGQSLTNTPGNYPWEHAPQYTDVMEAAEYTWDRLHDGKVADQVVTMLKEGIPVEALARMVLFGGFMEGKWTVDMAIIKKKGQDAATPGQTDAEKFAAEIKAELESKEPSGLMKKETE